MRGNLIHGHIHIDLIGSIPAYAGEPTVADRWGCCHGVYPRVCGGTRAWQARHNQRRGLSPRMRGNRQSKHEQALTRRSIPAYAGEPLTSILYASVTRVYPRVCGGTSSAGVLASSPKGLSPRMRGNRPTVSYSSGRPGSIPAYAGEPRIAADSAASDTVYPRVCGGTIRKRWRQSNWQGLSPRMRGNLSSDRSGQAAFRSIPAYAGEPV